MCAACALSSSKSLLKRVSAPAHPHCAISVVTCKSIGQRKRCQLRALAAFAAPLLKVCIGCLTYTLKRVRIGRTGDGQCMYFAELCVHLNLQCSVYVPSVCVHGYAVLHSDVDVPSSSAWAIHAL